ncbi:integral membrane protein [Drepanopeziza brunnea f. sp. 'multigermtubi' MB_m1]|uniref:Integral membrane protein n=1 Tax=Marssonina brunnea f. sp. multigermtubi (strain MB_m1) TaxID=1072389 RepID=K1WFT4_MARBU|nr:uncharacterized protein MBM_05649 [Drepanopeziza brunnea f. sp. 'multigermtubi' MB_m1]EKD16355.1 integral membrane protein [Drepanopeziza brunnea f. sp. 'multigermtubi' MB_m1]
MTYDLSFPRVRDPAIVASVFMSLALATTILRICSIRVRGVAFDVDDYLMIAAIVILGGIGRQSIDVKPQDITRSLQLAVMYWPMYAVTMALVKCSVICFYCRVFESVQHFRISAQLVLGTVVAWSVIIILSGYFICRPFAFNWDATIAGGVCADRTALLLSTSTFNVITDVLVLSLPIPHIMSLNLPLRVKGGILFMFSVGFFLTFISILRIVAIKEIDFSSPTYTLLECVFWSTLEPCLAIMNGNLPMVRSLLVVLAPSLFGVKVGSKSTTREMCINTIGGGSRGRGVGFQLMRKQSDTFAESGIRLGIESTIKPAKTLGKKGHQRNRSYVSRRSIDVEYCYATSSQELT